MYRFCPKTGVKICSKEISYGNGIRKWGKDMGQGKGVRKSDLFLNYVKKIREESNTNRLVDVEERKF